MAEFSLLHTTGTSGDGTTTYTEAQTTDAFGDFLTPNSTITAPHATQGVYAGAGGELAVTGTASPVSVAAGAATVAGFLYRNTAAVTVAIPTPSASTRIDRIVLRMSWSAHTVRITRIAGTEGAGAPAITQVDNTTWDIKLAQVSITTGGVITVTDERAFCHFATRLDKNQVDGLTAGSVAFADANGRLTQDNANLFFDDTNNRLGIGTTTPGSRLQVNGDSTAPATVDNAQMQIKGASNSNQQLRIGYDTTNDRGSIQAILHGSIAKPLLLNPSGGNVGVGTSTPATALDVTGQASISPASAAAPLIIGANGQGQLVTGLNADKVDGFDMLINRQGGDASNWASPGTTNQTVTTYRTQVGSVSVPNGSASQDVTVTFPVAFSNSPVVIANQTLGILDFTVVQVKTVSSTQATFTMFVTDGGTISGTPSIQWIAIGPP